MEGQYQRFCEVLGAKDGYFVNCDKCPIQKECEEASSKLTQEEADNQEPCEYALLKYVLNGERPS
jgi:hypothetical protein